MASVIGYETEANYQFKTVCSDIIKNITLVKKLE